MHSSKTSASGGFNGSIGYEVKENRLIDVDITGDLSSMAIFGGELKIGVVKFNAEVNLDEIASNALGGTGLGSEWKENQ